MAALAIRLAGVLPVLGVALCPAVADAAPHVIYLNRTGTTLLPGPNDSRLRTSSLINQPTTIPAWQTDDATWADTVACFKEIYAPFDVTVIDYDPGPDIDHVEGVFGGAPSMFGIASGSLGVSPFMSDCSMIERSIAFTFVDALPDSRSICEVMAQEVAHSYGIDHEMLPSDPMSYLFNDGPRAFQDVYAPCGEFAARPCGAGGFVCRPEQNSFVLLSERLGANPHPDDPDNPANAELSGGCSSTRGGATLPVVLVAVAALLSRRRTHSSPTYRSSVVDQVAALRTRSPRVAFPPRCAYRADAMTRIEVTRSVVLVTMVTALYARRASVRVHGRGSGRRSATRSAGHRTALARVPDVGQRCLGGTARLPLACARNGRS